MAYRDAVLAPTFKILELGIFKNLFVGISATRNVLINSLEN